MSTFTLEIKTPSQELYARDVDSVDVTTELGDMKLLAHHAQFLGALGYTRIKAHHAEGREEFVGRRGMVSFDNKANKATVLLLDCHLQKEFSVVSAKEYLAYVEERLASGEDLSTSQLKFMEEEKFMLEKQVADAEIKE